MASCASRATPTFNVIVDSTECIRYASISQTTFNVYSDPCDYLTTTLAGQVRTDMSVPPASVLSCFLISVSTLSDGRRLYQWDVTATWTE